MPNLNVLSTNNSNKNINANINNTNTYPNKKGKNINIIKKELVKQNILKGQSYKQSMINANYSKNTAISASNRKVVKDIRREIMQELLAKDVTVDLVIRNLNQDRSLAQKKGDISTMTRVDELLGKFLAIFTERQEIKQQINYTPDEIEEYNRLKNRLQEN